MQESSVAVNAAEAAPSRSCHVSGSAAGPGMGITAHPLPASGGGLPQEGRG